MPDTEGERNEGDVRGSPEIEEEEPAFHRPFEATRLSSAVSCGLIQFVVRPYAPASLYFQNFREEKGALTVNVATASLVHFSLSR